MSILCAHGFLCEHVYTFGHVSICGYNIRMCVEMCVQACSCGSVCVWVPVCLTCCTVWRVCVHVCKYGPCVAVCTCVYMRLPCAYAGMSMCIWGLCVCRVYLQVWVCLSMGTGVAVCTGIQVCIWV